MKKKSAFVNQCLEYTLREYKLVAYPVKSKAPNTTNWGDTNLDVDTIDKLAQISTNIGIITGSRSNGLLDIDADSEDAKHFLDHFLPVTNMVCGRKTSQRSHRFYQDESNSLKSYKYTDPITEDKKKVLFEIRSEGEQKEDGTPSAYQTMVPPSIHPNGESIEWDTFDYPTKVEPIPFKLACGTAAAATLLQRHFGNQTGIRHELAGALAGWLYKMKWELDKAKDFISIATIPLNDLSELDDRQRFIEDTYNNINNGRQLVTGFKRVAEIIGQRAAECLCEWLLLSQDDLILPERCTDVANAELFRKLHGENLLWIEAFKSWYVWSGTHWIRDETNHVTLLANDMINTIRNNALLILDDAQRVRMMKWVVLSEQSNRIQYIEKINKSYLCGTPAMLDSDPLLINFLNGTYDARTRKLREHRQSDHITKIIKYNYNKSAKSSRFNTFLDEILPKQLQSYVLRILGYCMTADVSERSFYVFHGDGNNGKSTLTGLIRKLLNDYTGVLSSESLMMKRGSSSNTDELAAMIGKRIALINETSQGQRLDAGLIKAITGGEDTIRVRRLYEKSFELTPTFKLVLSTNSKPNVSDISAFWKRVKLVPFTIQIPQEQIDLHIADKLLDEAEGVLNRLIEGLEDWRLNGMNEPTEVVEATQDYKSEQDQVGEFLAERVTITDNEIDKIIAAELYVMYSYWAESNNFFVYNRLQFSENVGKIFNRRAVTVRVKSGTESKVVKAWQGLKLNK